MTTEPESTQAKATEPEQPLVPIEKLRRILLGYRILAWFTGVMLIVLCYEMYVKYVQQVEDIPTWLTFVPQVHGFGYLGYLIFAAQLAMTVRWSLPKTIGVCLAGTIPLAGVIVEHFQTKELKARFGL